MEVSYKHITAMLLVVITLMLLPSTNANRILEFRDMNYSTWNYNATYISSTHYDSKGMGQLYVFTNKVLDLFIGEDVIPEGYLVFLDPDIKLGPKVKNNEWGKLLEKYWAILFIVCISALIIILMPIIGFCFCCCRCFGSCGSRSELYDKKHDTCRRVILGLFLIIAGTGLIFGVVIAFVTNSYLQQGVDNATTTARHGVDDSQKFLKTTSLEANHLLVKNYDELTHHLEYMLDGSTNVIIKQLEEQSKAISLTQLTTFVTDLPLVKIDLSRMKDITNGLRTNASQLSDGLRGVKRVLLVSLTNCPAQSCKNVLKDYEIGKLDINGIDYNQLPDVSTTIDSVENLISDEILDAVEEGQHALDNMRLKLNNTISENIPKITNAIKEAGSAIRGASDEITNTLSRISNVTGDNTYKHFDTADYYIKEYYKYFYYVGLALSSCLLLILLCIVLGLLCGVCGKRPDGYGDDCCNKGAGAQFLMIGVAVVFLTISVLTAFALVYFLSGLVLHRTVCVSLKNPENDEIFGYVDTFIDLNKIIYPEKAMRHSAHKSLKSNALVKDETSPFRISEVIVDCKKNKSIYKVLRLKNYFDITQILDYPARYGVDAKLQELIDNMEVESDIQILSPTAEKQINKLLESELRDFVAHRFTDNLNDDITRDDLNTIADKLSETADNISSNPEMADISASLKNQSVHLKMYQKNLVTPMTIQTKEMKTLVERLDTTLKFNKSSFEEAINAFLTEIKDAQTYINKNGTDFVRKVARELTTSLRDEINSYLNLVINKTQNELGKCEPMSNVYNSVLVGVCNRVIDPFNGFWAGIVWCVLIFLPTIIFSVKLSSLYQKSGPYPGPDIEEGIKCKRRKKNERRRNSRDRRGDYYEESGSPADPAIAPRDARYNDMAPKHWNNGGPPRYQNPPLAPPACEYERPPPYYFPAAQTDPE